MTLLNCSGVSLGLPGGQMGNFEVGHIHIGSCRYVPQEFSKVNDASKDGSFYSNKVLCQAIDTAKDKGKALHVLVLLSLAGSHSHEQQIITMIDMAAKRGLKNKNIYLHAFLGGSDVPPKRANASIELLDAKFAELGGGRTASIVGRFYAMDRDKRWERINSAYDLITKGKAGFDADSAIKGVGAAFSRVETDEFVLPAAISGASHSPVVLDSDDSAVFMNFLADRVRKISQALTSKTFNFFDRNCEPHKGYCCALTEYHEDFDNPVAFPSIDFKNGLGEVLANSGMAQSRFAETEKSAHVPLFLNGGTDRYAVSRRRQKIDAVAQSEDLRYAA